MFDLKLAAAFIGWTATTFVAHYSVKRILVTAAPGGTEVNIYTNIQIYKIHKYKNIARGTTDPDAPDTADAPDAPDALMLLMR